MSHHDRSEKKRMRVILSTCPPAAAEGLATSLVEKGLVACVNIIPQVTSIYRWEGKLMREGESLLVIKCSEARVEEVTAAILAEHPYDVPEVVALKVKEGNPDYIEWVVSSGVPSPP